jgi:hypothetical protein
MPHVAVDQLIDATASSTATPRPTNNTAGSQTNTRFAVVPRGARRTLRQGRTERAGPRRARVPPCVPSRRPRPAICSRPIGATSPAISAKQQRGTALHASCETGAHHAGLGSNWSCHVVVLSTRRRVDQVVQTRAKSSAIRSPFRPTGSSVAREHDRKGVSCSSKGSSRSCPRAGRRLRIRSAGLPGNTGSVEVLGGSRAGGTSRVVADLDAVAADFRIVDPLRTTSAMTHTAEVHSGTRIACERPIHGQRDADHTAAVMGTLGERPAARIAMSARSWAARERQHRPRSGNASSAGVGNESSAARTSVIQRIVRADSPPCALGCRARSARRHDREHHQEGGSGVTTILQVVSVQFHIARSPCSRKARHRQRTLPIL